MRAPLLSDFEHGFAPANPPSDVWQARQVHGRRVLVIDGAVPRADVGALDADGLAAAHPGLAVAVRSADCVPLLLAAPRLGAVAAVHAGWRGVVAGIAAEAIARLEALGAAPGELLAALGPCIGPCCFEVGEEVAAQFPLDVRRPRAGRKPTVDLRAALRLQLGAAGLRGTHISADAPCTYCDPDRLPSYRREGAAAGRITSWIRSR